MDYLQEKKKALMNSVVSGRLPSAYQEVGWIESSGGAYIDTNFYPSNNSKVILSGNQVVSSLNSMFGVNPLFVITSRNGSYRFRFNNNNLDSIVSANTKAILELSQNGAFINDNLIGTPAQASFTSTQRAILFGRRMSDGRLEELNKSRIYWCKLYNNGNPERDFVPCYRKSDGEIGLYDLVNNVFYTNNGTGTFTKGDDV